MKPEKVQLRVSKDDLLYIVSQLKPLSSSDKGSAWLTSLKLDPEVAGNAGLAWLPFYQEHQGLISALYWNHNEIGVVVLSNPTITIVLRYSTGVCRFTANPPGGVKPLGSVMVKRPRDAVIKAMEGFQAITEI